MAYYMNHFSEKTYRAFSASQRQIVGFPDSQMQRAENIHPGDKLICYMTKLSRIAGILEVESERYVDRSPIFASEDDPYVVRFRVRPLVWLELENAIPILDDDCWELLSFTRGREKTASAWAGMVRMSLRQFKDEDGAALEALLFRQTTEKRFIRCVEIIARRKEIPQMGAASKANLEKLRVIRSMRASKPCYRASANACTCRYGCRTRIGAKFCEYGSLNCARRFCRNCRFDMTERRCASSRTLM